MMRICLPPLVLLPDHDGDWDKYIEAVYRWFEIDFVEHVPEFRSARVSYRRYPMDQGKEAVFWHLISEGNEESDRLPSLRRCERIRWPRPIIEAPDCDDLKVWENVRRGKRSVCLWHCHEDYLVVLGVRNDYYLLLTAYPIDQPHTRRKLQREYEDYKANVAHQK